MSFIVSAVVGGTMTVGAGIMAGAAVVSAAATAYGAYAQNQGQKKAARAAQEAANKPLVPPPQAARTPDRAAMLAGNRLAPGGMAGNRSTYLTGPAGVSGGLNLGRNTLLGE